MIILIECYEKVVSYKEEKWRITKTWKEQDLNIYVNPSHIVWMDEQELSIKLSTGEKYYCRLHATWEYIRTIVYNYSK